jgi:hypothetical protein
MCDIGLPIKNPCVSCQSMGREYLPTFWIHEFCPFPFRVKGGGCQGESICLNENFFIFHEINFSANHKEVGAES